MSVLLELAPRLLRKQPNTKLPAVGGKEGARAISGSMERGEGTYLRCSSTSISSASFLCICSCNSSHRHDTPHRRSTNQTLCLSTAVARVGRRWVWIYGGTITCVFVRRMPRGVHTHLAHERRHVALARLAMAVKHPDIQLVAIRALPEPLLHYALVLARPRVAVLWIVPAPTTYSRCGSRPTHRGETDRGAIPTATLL